MNPHRPPLAPLLLLAVGLAACAGDRVPPERAAGGEGGDTGGADAAHLDGGETGAAAEAMVARIRTEVDPDYVYPFSGTRFVPPEGKTLLVVGQTLGDIDQHVGRFPDAPRPGGWAAYWGIPSLAGVRDTFRNDTGGRQNHQQLVERFPNTVLQSGLWMVGTWDVAKNTRNGVYDDVLRGFADWVKGIDRPLYLRIGYEFDGPHNALDPTVYVRAYRHVVDLLRAEGVENVAYVWHSYAAPTYEGHPLSAWYPGDDYVDWVGVSFFGHGYEAEPTAELDAVFAYAREKRKPVMVCEASPVGGIRASDDTAWDRWFVNFFSLAYARNVKAISFIDTDWTRYTFPGLDWADARLQNDPHVAAAWFLETGKDRYLKQSPDLFRQLGYAP